MRITVNGTEYDIRFSYSRDEGKHPYDTYVEVAEAGTTTPLAWAWATLHPLDQNNFSYKKGRKIALSRAVSALWPREQLEARREFWEQVKFLVQ